MIGIGNDLVGDDGVGPAVIAALRRREGVADHPDIYLDTLDGDLMAVSELLGAAPRFIFVDAVAGDPPGRVIRDTTRARAFAPSLHQLDVSAVMATLDQLGMVVPFPRWQVWGVTVRPPTELGRGLSPEVAEAVDRLVELLHREIVVEVGDARAAD